MLHIIFLCCGLVLQEGTFFSLYELTNKGSSAIGPVILTVIQQTTGDLRWGFIFILLNILIPMVRRGGMKDGGYRASLDMSSLV